MESYANLLDPKEYTLTSIKTASNITKIKSINNTSLITIDETNQISCLEIHDEEDFLDSKQSTYGTEKPKGLTKYVKKKLTLTLDEQWLLTVTDKGIDIEHQEDKKRHFHTTINDNIIYIKALNAKDLIAITKKKKSQLISCKLLKWENNRLSIMNLHIDISPQNRFYPLTAEQFIRVEPTTAGCLLHLYGIDSHQATNTFQVPYQINCIKMLPDNETLVFFLANAPINEKFLYLLNIMTGEVNKIAIDKQIVDFDILPNGKIMVATQDTNIKQINLRSIKDLRQQNVLVLKEVISQANSSLSGNLAKIITSYLPLSSNINALFNQYKKHAPILADDKKCGPTKYKNNMRSRL